MDDRTEIQASAMATARFWQPLVCGALLATIAVSGLLVDMLANSETFGIWLDRHWAAANDTIILYDRQYLDTEDCVVLDQIPKLDISDGGVYFFGSSNMKWATRTLDLPPDDRRLIHIFAGAEGSPKFQLQTIDYLVKYKKLLQAGPEKTLIIYGATLLNIRPAVDNPGTMYPNLWRRYGLYDYDLANGIRPRTEGPLAQRYLLEKARCASLIQGLLERGCRLLIPKALRRRNMSRDHKELARVYADRLGARWREYMAEHRRELESFIDYHQQRRINVAIVLLPLASWHRTMPYTTPYRQLVEELCKSHSIPFIDLSNVLADEEFEDHIHAGAQGVDILDPILMKLARTHLRSTGALPAGTDQR
jgi:hypothetical protein